jgi:ribosome maturation factor RimP
MIEEKIKKLVNERCLEDDLKDCFLVSVQLSKSKNLTVFIDSDTGVSYAKCRVISRHLEAAIEENGWLPEKYTLNVSSPGAEKPFKIPRQYNKLIGRELKVLMKDDKEIVGELIKVNDQNIELSTKKQGNLEIDFNDINHSSVILKFK